MATKTKIKVIKTEKSNKLTLDERIIQLQENQIFGIVEQYLVEDFIEFLRELDQTKILSFEQDQIKSILLNPLIVPQTKIELSKYFIDSDKVKSLKDKEYVINRDIIIEDPNNKLFGINANEPFKTEKVRLNLKSTKQFPPNPIKNYYNNLDKITNFEFYSKKIFKFYRDQQGKLFDLEKDSPKLLNLLNIIRGLPRQYFVQGLIKDSVSSKKTLLPDINPSTIKFSNPKFIETIEKIFKIKIDSIDLNVQQYGFVFGFLNEYVFSKLGQDMTKYLGKMQLEMNVKEFVRKTRELSVEDEYKFAHFMKIIEEILPSKRIQELHLIIKNNNIFTFGGLKLLLTNAELKQVTTIYNSDVTAWKAYVTNDCPHVIQYNKFRKNYQSIDLLLEYASSSQNLGDLISKPATKYIKCKMCKLDLICPHLVLQTKMIMEGKPPNDIINALEPYIGEIINKFVLFCNICGEKIGDTSDKFKEDFKKDFDYVREEDPLLNKLWGLTYRILNYFDITELVPVKFLVQNTVYSCKPLIESLQSAMKRLDETEKFAKLTYHSTMILLMYLIHRAETDKDVKLQGIIHDTKDKQIINKYLAKSLIILNSLSVIPVDVPRKQVIVDLKNAYKITLSMSVVELPKRNINRDLVVYLQFVSSTYNYVRLANSINDKTKYKSPYQRIEKYMGMPINRMYKSKFLFEKVLIPKFPNQDKYLQFMQSLNVKNYNFDIKTLANSRFLLFYQLFVDLIQGKTLPELPNLSKAEFIYKFYLRIHLAKSIYNLYLKQLSIDPEIRPLNEVYDEQGNKHNWSLYVFKNESEPLTLKDVANKLPKTKLIGLKCSICGVLYNEVSKLDINKIKKSLKSNAMNNAFWDYYEFRCPVFGIHDFVDDECSKCKLKQNTRSKEYFDKWSENMKLEKPLKVQKIELEKKKLVKPKFLEKYEYDLKDTIDMVKTFKLNQNTFTLLGLAENRDYEEIKLGKIKPQFNETRSQTLNTYYQYLTIGYNQIMYQSFQLLKPKLRKLIEDSKLSANYYTDLAKHLPDLPEYYNESREYLINSKASPKDICEFTLYSIANVVMTIYNNQVKNKDLKSFMETFAKFIIKEILEQDKMKSKPKKMRLDEDLVETGNVNYDETQDYEYEDETEIAKKDEESDAFQYDTGYEQMDYDGVNDEDSYVDYEHDD